MTRTQAGSAKSTGGLETVAAPRVDGHVDLPRMLTCLVAAILLVAGCDSRPRRATISGQVLIDGQPLTQGVVQFVPADSRPSMGILDETGHFEMTCYGDNDGAILGNHRVAIIASEYLSASKTKWHAPKKYADPATSGLTIEIREPRDNVVFELTWDGGKPFIEVIGGETGSMGDDI